MDNPEKKKRICNFLVHLASQNVHNQLKSDWKCNRNIHILFHFLMYYTRNHFGGFPPLAFQKLVFKN